MEASSRDRPSGEVAVCDVCGRAAPVARRYLLYSRRVHVPDDRSAWKRDGPELPPQEPDFQGREFPVCAFCERRKLLFWIVAAGGLVVWVPLVWKHAGLGFAYLFVFLVVMSMLGRLVPVNRLLRKLRRQRRAEFPDLLSGKRITYQFFTPGGLAFQQTPAARSEAPAQHPASTGPEFQCSTCGRPLEELGVPAEIRLAQSYREVVDIGTEGVPEAVRRDPFLYKGLWCTACAKAFCPACAGQQSERCPACGAAGLQPAYRPYLTGEARR